MLLKTYKITMRNRLFTYEAFFRAQCEMEVREAFSLADIVSIEVA